MNCGSFLGPGEPVRRSTTFQGVLVLWLDSVFELLLFVFFFSSMIIKGEMSVLIWIGLFPYRYRVLGRLAEHGSVSSKQYSSLGYRFVELSSLDLLQYYYGSFQEAWYCTISLPRKCTGYRNQKYQPPSRVRWVAALSQGKATTSAFTSTSPISLAKLAQASAERKACFNFKHEAPRLSSFWPIAVSFHGWLNTVHAQMVRS